MSKIYPSITRVLTVAMFVTSAFADTVTLKSGEHLEGKITKETDKDVTIEVKISAGIVDERVVPKAEIVKIDKMSAELQAFQAIERIQPQPNSPAAAQYDQYIGALEAYVTQFPNSVRAADVQKTLNVFQEEKKRVDSGEVKINGSWISKDEAEKEKAQIGGRLAFNYMKAQSSAGDYVDALNAFAALEKAYPGASVMPDAIELAQKIIPALQAELKRAIPEQEVLKAQRAKGMSTAGPAQRAQIQEAAKNEDDSAEAAAAAADAAGHWAPLIRNNAKCLASLQARATKEAQRLAALHPEKMRQSLQLTETARQSLADGKLEAANAALKEAATLWPANEIAKRLTKDATAQKASAATVDTAPAATPVPLPPAKAAPKPAPKKVTPRPSAAAQESAAPIASNAAQSDSGEERPFYLKLPGAIGVVVGCVAVLAGANVFVKMKKRKAEQADRP